MVNHIGDFGPKPVLETMKILKRNGFKTVGAGKNLDDAYKPLICKAGGITVGILNIAENEFGSAKPDKPGSAPLNPCLNIRLSDSREVLIPLHEDFILEADARTHTLSLELPEGLY